MSVFLPIRQRLCKKVLMKLREHSSIGPDNLSSKVLKYCSGALAYAIALIARAIISEKRWPTSWRVHWIYSLYKRKSKSNAVNYWGIHLTAQVSKVLERIIGHLFLSFLDCSGVYGPREFAYRQKRGSRDVWFTT